MSSHATGEDVIGVSADGRNLPSTLTKVKPSAERDQNFEEEFVLEIPLNRGREKLVVSKLAADWGGRFVCIRFWAQRADGTYSPTSRGLNIRADFVEAVAAAMTMAVAR